MHGDRSLNSNQTRLRTLPAAFWLSAVLFPVAVVAGALVLIVTRGELLALDLGPNVARWLWCF